MGPPLITQNYITGCLKMDFLNATIAFKEHFRQKVYFVLCFLQGRGEMSFRGFGEPQIETPCTVYHSYRPALGIIQCIRFAQNIPLSKQKHSFTSFLFYFLQ